MVQSLMFSGGLLSNRELPLWIGGSVDHSLFFANFTGIESIFGEGSQIPTNQKRERTVFSLLIGRNLRPFPKNTVLYKD